MSSNLTTWTMITKRTYDIVDVEFLSFYTLATQFCSCSSPQKCSFPKDCPYKGMESFDEWWAKAFSPEVRIIVEDRETKKKMVGTVRGSIKWEPIEE